jgi:hypothetical protein
MKTSSKKKNVSHETPPVNDSGPIYRLDPDELEDRLSRLSYQDQKKLLDLIDSYKAVMFSKDSHS